jgi:hypothetical protein
MVVQRAQISQHLRIAIRMRPDSIDEIRSRKMQSRFVDLRLVIEKVVGIRAEQLLDGRCRG